MKMRGYFVVFSLLFLLLSASVVAQEISGEEIDQARIDLFTASQRMLAEQRRPPHMRVGMVLTNLGEGSEVDFGAKVESNLCFDGAVRLVTETIYLKEEDTLAGFLSLKLVPAMPNSLVPLYFGGGAGYINGLKYQVFAGVELTKNLYAEIRYINLPGGIADKGLYFATGFQFTY